VIDRLAELEARFDEISRLLGSPDVAADPAQLQSLGREHARLEPIVTAFADLRAIGDELTKARELADEPDEELRALAAEEVGRLTERQHAVEAQLRAMLVPRDPNDERDVIVELRAGTGGEEASLFAAELSRMYVRYATERRGWGVDLLSTSESASGGYKEAILEIRGAGAFSRLKFESGVHRVQRVPVTEASGRIHTSTATVSVLPEADEVDVVIDEARDLKIDVYRSRGPGGQSVNTTDSAVRVRHLPTGLVVAIQDEKSQHKNKAKALSVLRARLLEMEQQRLAEERGEQRRTQVGSGERSEKIRTYNFPDDRVTDHRIGLTVHDLPGLLDGNLDRIIEPLMEAERTERLAGIGADGTDGSR
jgi:peptide chain release factor 1